MNEKECPSVQRRSFDSLRTLGCRLFSGRSEPRDDTVRSFGKFLQGKHEENRITLRKMAELLEFSAPFLSDVEKGRRNPPDLLKLEQIAQILKLTTEEKHTMFDLAGK